MTAETIKDLVLDGSTGLLESVRLEDSNLVSLGRWYDGVQQGSEATMLDFDGLSDELRERLDKYITLKIGKSVLLDDFKLEDADTQRVTEVYSDIATILLANEYTLNNAYYSTLLAFNPIDNYDRTETQTHNDTANIGERSVTNNIGQRSSTSNNGARTDSMTDSNSTTAFDSADYDKATNKATRFMSTGATTDTTTQDSATDSTHTSSATDSTTGGYTLRARGNIGVTTSVTMLSEYRQVMYNFFDKVCDVIKENITEMIYF